MSVDRDRDTRERPNRDKSHVGQTIFPIAAMHSCEIRKTNVLSQLSRLLSMLREARVIIDIKYIFTFLPEKVPVVLIVLSACATITT